MFRAYWRHGVVVTLVVIAGLGGGWVAAPPSVAAALPPTGVFTVGTGWQIISAFRGDSTPAFVYRQWRLRDARGAEVVLYIGATSQVKNTVHWNGQLGYAGEGYLTIREEQQSLALPDDTMASVDVALVQRLGDRQRLVSAVVSPDGVVAAGTINVAQVLWEALRGSPGPYYLVRLAIPEGSSARSTDLASARLLASTLASLRTRARVLATTAGDGRGAGG